MKVTICELNDERKAFAEDWESLTEYLDREPSDLLLLPEMPFCEWWADTPEFNSEKQLSAVEIHAEYIKNFETLHAKNILYSRPVAKNGRFHNVAFIWNAVRGEVPVHTKQYFPQEPYFYEETWFDADDTGFKVLEVEGLRIGVLLCTEMWFTQHARKYGELGADLLLCPRATGISSVDQWIRCGQTLAVISGAFCLSSNRTGTAGNGFRWGGNGWIAQPADGKLLGVTSARQKFLTIDIDISLAQNAKKEYPLYVNTR